MSDRERLKVSVVIPTFNLRDVLLQCLESITKQDYPLTEIIVVDNASTDGTSDAVAQKFPQVILIKNPINLGVTGGVNTGLEQATGDYIWFVDHDNIFLQDTLSEMVLLAETDSKIGIVVPKIYYWENKNIIWAAGTGMNMIIGSNTSRSGLDIGQYEKIEEVQIAPANFLVRRSVINGIGFYDNLYCISYEDADFSFRTREAGFKIVYTPKAVCYHMIPLLNKESGKKRWLSRAYWAARNKIIFMRKYSPFFPLFITLYPIWFSIYTYQAIRYGSFNDLRNFYTGIISGLKWAFFDYKKSIK
ncbi:MAG: glycosyltransferase family 2 protein [Candidatus Falkowbacteria bacterium]|nr:glycosyltransferase family 2 protein [Candidatus Falkowbacteria bacterium]